MSEHKKMSFLTKGGEKLELRSRDSTEIVNGKREKVGPGGCRQSRVESDRGRQERGLRQGDARK